jgi:hypothetical protein
MVTQAASSAFADLAQLGPFVKAIEEPTSIAPDYLELMEFVGSTVFPCWSFWFFF